MQRLAELHSPLGADLLFHGLAGTERLSETSEFTLALLSPKDDIDFKQVLGQHMSVQMRLPEQDAGHAGLRYLDGLVSRIRYTGLQGRYHSYEATIRPWLWFLSRTQDCRIFQDQSVVQIVQAVFADHSIAKVDISKLTGTYTPWHYCVQYRETDLNFVMRMMEQEGISFYFTHAKGEHTLVLADGIASHSPFAGYGKIPFANQRRPVGAGAAGAGSLGGEAIQSFGLRQTVQTGKVVLTDYDFERPGVNLQQQRVDPRPHRLAAEEVFDYPGLYIKEADGEQFARHQQEALTAQTATASGKTDARGLAAGYLFDLSGFAVPDQNRQYLITSTSIKLTQAGYEGADSDADADSTSGSAYTCDFEVIDARTPFRPVRATKKPAVKGPQTAVVVGPADQEIHTDQYGRVKVHFHWDRYGQRNGSDTCWLRVSLPWAGANWGAQFLPRIGQEVIVDFIEGDPDQPIVTGRVYNAEQRPSRFSNAGSLPGNIALAGFKSKELAGGGYNQWLFDDTTGQLRTQVASTEGASQLNLGYLVHPRAEADKQAGGSAPSNSGSASPRGQGFELRTDAWGAIRAAKGLLITTDGKSQAVGGALDRAELIACLSEALTLAKSLSGNAAASDTATESGKAAYATAKDDHKAQDTQLTNIKGLNQSANDGANVTEPTAPHLSLFSPAGIALASPKSITSYSGSNSDTIAQRNLHSTSGQQTHLHAGTGIRAFAQSGGIHAIANQGKLLLQSQHDDTVVNAEQSIHLTATQQHVLIEAKQHITLVESGGAYIKLAGGNVEIGMPGSFTVKAASYKLTGPGNGQAELPSFVKGEVGRKFQLLDPASGKPLKDMAFKITKADGSIVEGKTDATGHSPLQEAEHYTMAAIEFLKKP